jgi:hypothetical protein
MGLVIFGVTAMVFNYSAKHEHRTAFPEQGRFYPSRWYAIEQIPRHKMCVNQCSIGGRKRSLKTIRE